MGPFPRTHWARWAFISMRGLEANTDVEETCYGPMYGQPSRGNDSIHHVWH